MTLSSGSETRSQASPESTTRSTTPSRPPHSPAREKSSEVNLFNSSLCLSIDAKASVAQSVKHPGLRSLKGGATDLTWF